MSTVSRIISNIVSVPRRLAVLLIRGYQRAISPLFPPACRFAPTCSSYAITAIGRFGLIRGGAMAVWRILRCNPWNAGGYDPVPEKECRH